MHRLTSLLTALVLFAAGLFSIFPLGSDRRAPLNRGTVAFEHLANLAWPAAKIVTFALGLSAIGVFCGTESAAAIFLCCVLLCAPRAAHALGISAVPFDAPDRPGLVLDVPVAAATALYAGTMAAADVNGRAVPASDAAGLRVLGRIERDADNSAGAAGAISVQIKRGTFRYQNSGTQPVTQAYLGKLVFVEDDITVAITSTYKIVAGRVVAVDSDGVWVDTRAARTTGLTDSSGGTAGTTIAAGAGVHTISLPLILSKIGNADVLTNYTPGYAFKLLSTTVAVTSPVTTAAKAATLNLEIGAVDVTGGVVALTSANSTPLGALVAGSAITANNIGTSADTISVEATGVTAFVEGEGVLLLKIQNLDTANAIASLAALAAA